MARQKKYLIQKFIQQEKIGETVFGISVILVLFRFEKRKDIFKNHLSSSNEFTKPFLKNT